MRKGGIFIITKIKLCGLSRLHDIDYVNELLPDYIGFVFYGKSKRYISPEKALMLRKNLDERISVVGVFVDEIPEKIVDIVNQNIIDIIQLHGQENNEYIDNLRKLTRKKIIKAVKINDINDINSANNSTADYIMLDSGAGTGKLFDWDLIHDISRKYFLAGGLTPENVREAINKLNPYCVDVSSGIETNGVKDKSKMTAFINAVRKEN